MTVDVPYKTSAENVSSDLRRSGYVGVFVIVVDSFSDTFILNYASVSNVHYRIFHYKFTTKFVWRLPMSEKRDHLRKRKLITNTQDPLLQDTRPDRHSEWRSTVRNEVSLLFRCIVEQEWEHTTVGDSDYCVLVKVHCERTKTENLELWMCNTYVNVGTVGRGSFGEENLVVSEDCLIKIVNRTIYRRNYLMFRKTIVIHKRC